MQERQLDLFGRKRDNEEVKRHIARLSADCEFHLTHGQIAYAKRASRSAFRAVGRHD